MIEKNIVANRITTVYYLKGLLPTFVPIMLTDDVRKSKLLSETWQLCCQYDCK